MKKLWMPLASATIVIASTTWAAWGSAQGPVIRQPVLAARLKALGNIAFPPKLTNRQKATTAGALLKTKVVGVTDQLTLDVRSPYLSSQGSLELFDFFKVSASENLAAGSGTEYATPIVTFRVAKPNKPHLVTFYINAGVAQRFVVEGAVNIFSIASQDLMQSKSVPAGPNALSCVVTPKAAGNYSVLIQSEDRKPYVLTRVEVAVVD
jgi:hypothetical protein